MNRYLTVSLAISVTLSTLAIPLRAANKPRAGKMEKITEVWTNEDLERLRAPGLISIVGQSATAEDVTAVALPSPCEMTQDYEWYAEQAASLRDELERRQARLHRCQQALEECAKSPGDDGWHKSRGRDWKLCVGVLTY